MKMCIAFRDSGLQQKCMPKKLGARAVCRVSSLDHPKDRLHHFLLSHPFNSSLSLICPSCTGPELKRVHLHQHWYQVTCQVSAFLSPAFLEREVTSEGSDFVALAHKTAGPGHSEAVAICGGALHLTVGQATYERLGLVGSRSALKPGRRCKHFVQAGSPCCLCKLRTPVSQRSITYKSSSDQRRSEPVKVLI